MNRSIFVGAILLAAPLACVADMMSIPSPGVTVMEPKQDAVIAWSGKQEVIYLKTTQKATAATPVVEVMPLPSKPDVDVCDKDFFKRMAIITPRKVVRNDGAAAGGADPFASAGGAPPPSPPAGEVVEVKRMGVHDLTTVKVVDKDHFTKWLQERFGKDRKIEVTPKMLELVEAYLKDNYQWFLFDRIDLTTELQEKEALRICFESNVLYYPLRISRTEEGATQCSLTIVTNEVFGPTDFFGLPRDRVRLFNHPISVSGANIRWVDEIMWNVLGKPAEAKIRTWEINAMIDSLTADILVEPNHKPVKK